jgi:hypothetical protein
LDNIDENKRQNIGICVDTAHIWGKGDYDLRKISEIDFTSVADPMKEEELNAAFEETGEKFRKLYDMKETLRFQAVSAYDAYVYYCQYQNKILESRRRPSNGNLSTPVSLLVSKQYFDKFIIDYIKPEFIDEYGFILPSWWNCE